jgi:urease accessory protein
MMRIGSRILGATLAALAAFAPEFAVAHTGHGEGSGFLHGALHPLGGADHLLTMITVGLLAANLGGRVLWALPLSFVSAVLAGGLIAINGMPAPFVGMPMPFVELGIALSVVVLGLVTASTVNGLVMATMTLASAFALFHGYAHGAEMPADTSGAAYAAGFVLATALLHIGGIGLGLSAKRFGDGPKVIRIAGLLVACAGVGLVAMHIAGA